MFNRLKELSERENLGLFLLIFISLVARVLFLNRNLMVWWDSSVYIGMGKFICSFGKIGLWESIRPVLLPFMLGSLWKAGLNPVLGGRFLEIFLSLGSVFLTYRIGERLSGKKFGLFASTIFTFTSFFIYYSVRILTGIPSVFFTLLSLYFFLGEGRKNYLISGFFAGLAFLTRFPQGILLVALISVLVLKELIKSNRTQALENILLLIVAFSLTISPLIIFNFLNYSSPLHPFIKAASVARQNLWAHSARFYFYVKQLAIYNPVLLLSFPGIALYLKRKSLSSNKIILAILPLLYLVYFSMFPNKQLRFSLVFLPYLALMSAYAVKKFYSLDLFTKKIRSLAVLALLVLLLYTAARGTSEYLGYFPTQRNEVNRFYDEVSSRNLKGELVLSNTPTVAAFSDAKVKMMYRGLTSVVSEANITYERHKDKASWITINSCQPACPEKDEKCRNLRQEFFSKVDLQNKERFQTSFKGCNYIIYES